MAMTLREIDLAWKAKSDWDRQQTAELMAAIYNIRPRGKGDKRTFVGADFYRPSDAKQTPRKAATSGTRLTIGLLRALKGKIFQDN